MTKAMTRNDADQRPDNHVMVLFGATGDLARRKLLPGLHHLFRAGLLKCPDRLLRGEQHRHCGESKAKGHARLPESSI